MHFLLVILQLTTPILMFWPSPGLSCNFPSWPKATGTKTVSATISVSGTFDGKFVRYSATAALGSGNQAENQKPIFRLAKGATLKNVIIDKNGADGIHCDGSCNLENVWWEDVGEDAATFRSNDANAVYTVNIGGARSASDKVFQQDGPGTVKISNFQVTDFGKLCRSCGSCKKQPPRRAVLDCIKATNGKILAAINTNFGDKITLSNLFLTNVPKICGLYNGVYSGEPARVKDLTMKDKPYGGCNY